jgi:hypothetical protein
LREALRGYDHSGAQKGTLVGVLQAFERRLGGLVEGAFAKVFKGDVQPAEIAVALQRESDEKKNIVAQGRVLVPNEYVVDLGPHDYARLEEWADPLGAELATMVREHAAESGYSFVGPVTVSFAEQADIGTGVFRIHSAVTPGEGAPDPVAPPARSSPDGALPGRPRLIRSMDGDDSAYYLSHPVTVVGRAAECDLRLNETDVSRRHAEFRYADGEVELIDLGSTNGVLVNGQPAARASLRDGDRIDVGSTTLIFRRDEG